MKYIFTADIHLQDFSNDDKVTEDGIKLKLKELLDCFNQLCLYAQNNNISKVIIGGDINHNKNVVSARSFSRFKRIIENYKDIEFTIMPGNHDIISQTNDTESACDLFIGHTNVRLINDVFKDGNITYIPHSCKLFEKISKDKGNDILISHLPLSEGKVDSGLSINTKFSKKHLNKYKLVLLGDYHTHQKIDHIYYPGTLIPLTKSEREDKGFIVFDSQTLDIEFIKTTGYRRYLEIVIDNNTDLDNVKKEIEENISENNIITIKNTTKEIPKEISELIENVNYIDQYETEQNIRGICSSMNIQEQMKKYLEIKEIKSTDFEDYINLGLKSIN